MGCRLQDCSQFGTNILVDSLLTGPNQPPIPHGSRRPWINGTVWSPPQCGLTLVTGTLFLLLVPVCAYVILGSVDADHHIDVGPDAQQLVLDGCWVENAPPVVDTGRHTLEQSRAHGCRYLVAGGGFRGGYSHVDLGSTTVADADGSAVELFGSEPGRITSANVKLARAVRG